MTPAVVFLDRLTMVAIILGPQRMEPSGTYESSRDAPPAAPGHSGTVPTTAAEAVTGLPPHRAGSDSSAAVWANMVQKLVNQSVNNWLIHE